MLKKTFIILFFIFLIIPALLTDFSETGRSDWENRNLAGFPMLKDQAGAWNPGVFSEFDDWFRDHVGLREQFHDASSFVDYEIFRSSGTDRVTVGKDGWLFVNSEHNVENGQGEYRLGEEVMSTIAWNLCALRDSLAKEGREFVFVMTPGKSSVYPEYLPGHFSVGATASDELYTYLTEHTDLKVVNLKAALIENRNNAFGAPLYFKTDTHWNQVGAYFGYQELVRRLNGFGLLDSPPENGSCRFDDEAYESVEGDLIRLIRGPKEQYFERAPLMEQEHRENIREITEGELNDRLQQYVRGNSTHLVRLYENAAKEDPSILLLGDSFSGLLKQPLAHHAGRLVYSWEYYPSKELFEIADPDLVILECGERMLDVLAQHVNVQRNGDRLEVSYIAPKIYDSFAFAVWSEDYGKDDFAWYQGENKTDKRQWTTELDLRDHRPYRHLYIHGRAKTEDGEETVFFWDRDFDDGSEQTGGSATDETGRQ